MHFFNSLFPSSASNIAPRVDHLFVALLIVCAIVATLVFVFVLYFCIRYRDGSKADRSPAKCGALRFEVTWTVIPLLIFIGFFFWAAKVFFGMSRAPAGATEIYVVGKQWMWKVQHPDGQREINTPPSRKSTGQTHDDLAGRNPRLLCARLSNQTGRDPRALHHRMVHAYPTRHVPLLLLAILWD